MIRNIYLMQDLPKNDGTIGKDGTKLLRLRVVVRARMAASEGRAERKIAYREPPMRRTRTIDFRF